ncbi:MAG: class I SAM-dependent methyltransferase [bacterium]|nr:methyltransferase domain-containing protein [bacterium]
MKNISVSQKDEDISACKDILLHNEFVAETEKIKKYLVKLTGQLDFFDKSHSLVGDRIRHINSIKGSVFESLNKHFIAVWEVAKDFSKIEYAAHQTYYKNELLILLATPPLNKRIYEKPLGYAGDYVMMNYYYNDKYEGNSSYEMLLHRYTLELPIARAHINRKAYFKQRLKETIQQKPALARITSFGCGPAQEIIEFLQENRTLNNVLFNCVDIEPSALQHIKEKLKNISVSESCRVVFHNLNILSIVRRSGVDENLKDQDFIYAAGLFDYLEDKIARAVLKGMYSLLSNSGTLIIVNVHKKHNSRAYMELLGEWYLNLRNDKDLLLLTSNLKDTSEIRIEADTETSKNLYLVVKKQE